jgi:Flp pilus assembly pilin Flp
MKGIKGFFKRLWQDESGQGSTEYILVLALLVAIIIMFRKTITAKVGELVNTVMGGVTKTGSDMISGSGTT